jgi:outer membrane protein TolC
MKTLMALIPLIVLVLQGVSQSQSELTLEYCQEQARNNYPLIHRFALIEQSHAYTISNINNSFLPQLDLSAIGGVMDGLPSFSPQGGESSSPEYKLIAIAQLNQVIWDGGIARARKEMQQASTDVDIAQLEASLYAVRERINHLYMGILLIDEQIKRLDLLYSNLDRNLQRVQSAVQNGTAHATDIDEIRVKMIETRQKAQELRHNRQAWAEVLSAMTTLQINENTRLRAPSTDHIVRGPISRPELNTFGKMDRLANSQLQLKTSALYPKVGIMGVGLFIHPAVNFGMSETGRLLLGGLNLRWNLQGLYAHKNNKKLTGIQLSEISNQRDVFLFNTRLKLLQTSREMKKYRSLIEQDKAIIELKERIRASYEIRYQNGVCTMSDLLDRINEESIAHAKLSVHRIQYAMQALQYKYESGNQSK